MKLSNIKHLILTTILCALTVIAAKAQSCPKTNGIVGIEADATRVVYTLHGDVTGVMTPDNNRPVFTAAAAGNVYTSTDDGATGTSVVVGGAYNPATKYYTAENSWEQLFTSNGNVPTQYYNDASGNYTGAVSTTTNWVESKINAVNMYKFYTGNAETLWDARAINLYPVEVASVTNSWSDAVEEKYVYTVAYLNPDSQWFGQISRITKSSEASGIGEFVYNDETCVQLIISDKEITGMGDNNQFSSLPSGAHFMTKAEFPTYCSSTTNIRIKGEKYGVGYITYDKYGKITVDGTQYVNYVKSTEELSNGVVVALPDSRITLMDDASMDALKKQMLVLTVDGGKITSSTGYENPGSFVFNANTYSYRLTSDNELSHGEKVYLGDAGINVLTPSEFNEYISVNCTYYAGTAGLYRSTDGGVTKQLLTSGQEYTYNDGDTFWKVTGATYTEIADNTLFFGTDHTNYIEAKQIPVAESIVADALANGYTEVVFKSCDCGTAVIDNAFTQQLMKSTNIRVLNLAGVGIQQIVSPYTSSEMSEVNPNGTFVCAGNVHGSNTSIETLYTPMVIGSTIEEKSLLWGTFSKMPKLRYLYLSEGIETLGNKSVMGLEYHLSTITFPNSLKYIKNAAVSGHGSTKTAQGNSVPLYDLDNNEIEYIQTLTFPAGLREIESGAFGGTCPKDVYFLGVEAPRVGLHAWGDDAYISNNALTPAAATIGTAGAQVEVNLDKGRACRYNYTAQSGWIAMLHYPAECTKAQAAKYTDVTRDYRRIVYNTYSESEGKDPDDPTMSYSDNCTHYIPGKETTPLVGKALATSGAATNDFTNLYPWPEEDLHVGNAYSRSEWPEGYYGGNYSGGYYDYTVGDQYLWPSIGMAYRATVVAQNDVLWDGVTTIGEGIRKAGNASFEGNGSEYIGLHQFVFAAADVKGTSTTEWELEKYADGKWHTICLPFNMTKKQMKETFGAAGRNPETNELIYNIKLCKFNNVKRNDQLIQLYFTDEQFNNGKFGEDEVVLQAHVSYMIKAEKDRAINSVVFHNFKMEPGSPIPTQLSCDPESTRPTSGKYRFIGNYTKYATSTNADPTTIKIPQYSYFFSGTYHKFRFQTGNNGIWSPYSSVVYTPEGAGEDDFNTYFNGISTTMLLAKVSTFYEIEDTPTEVMAIVAGDNELVYTNANIYTIGGQLVGNSVNGLRPGIYVVNGKKFFVR